MIKTKKKAKIYAEFQENKILIFEFMYHETNVYIIIMQLWILQPKTIMQNNKYHNLTYLVYTLYGKIK